MLHLIHPAFVHFSIALLVLGGVAEAAGLFATRESLCRFGGTLVVLGTLSLVPTIVTGFLAANTVTPAAAATGLLGSHERNGLLLLGCFVALQFWKAWHRGQLPENQRRAYAALLLLGVLLATYSAWLGGQLVYRYGVGVLG